MLNFFKPNTKNTGSLAGFSFNSKEGKLYVQFVKQTCQGDANHVGAFKGGAKFNITLNAMEIGHILNVIERGSIEKPLFHKSTKGSTSIDIYPYPKAVEGQPPKPRNGFAISVNPRANEGEEKPMTHGFWFNNAEQRTLKEYLQFVLEKFFSASYAADKKRREAYAKGERGASEAPEANSQGEEDPLA